MDSIWNVVQNSADNAFVSILGVTSEAVTENQQQTTTAVATTPTDPNSGAVNPQPSPFMQFAPIILIFVVMYFMLFRGPRKKQQQHRQMVQALEKNDKVRTIGGILGTVIEVKENEVTLKVDESNNTKIKVLPSAIATNISKEEKK
ncbi:MAG TPA: preprotein translocase subunit YajC [Sedimentisphaerales bacterium]|nr:preprotein translocase subunit YajC [Sedimentisphaerales bacterium]